MNSVKRPSGLPAIGTFLRSIQDNSVLYRDDEHFRSEVDTAVRAFSTLEQKVDSIVDQLESNNGLQASSDIFSVFATNAY